jgi:hypothetical protein
MKLHVHVIAIPAHLISDVWLLLFTVSSYAYR